MKTFNCSDFSSFTRYCVLFRKRKQVVIHDPWLSWFSRSRYCHIISNCFAFQNSFANDICDTSLPEPSWIQNGSSHSSAKLFFDLHARLVVLVHNFENIARHYSSRGPKNWWLNMVSRLALFMYYIRGIGISSPSTLFFFQADCACVAACWASYEADPFLFCRSSLFLAFSASLKFRLNV